MMLGSAGVPNLAAWWSERGRPGYFDNASLGSGAPWTLAGHALGGWTLDEPLRAPRGLPFPGQMTVHTNIAMYDSVSVTVGEGSGWYGFGGSLARTTAFPKNHRVKQAGGVIDLRNGEFEFDEDALLIERSDEKTWLRFEVMSGTRGMFSGFDVAGRHVWSVAGGYQGGRNRFHGGFSERGSASALIGTEEQAASGESGFVGYQRRFGDFDLDLEAFRGHGTHESFGSFFIVPRPTFGFSLLRSSRDAHETGFEGELTGPLGANQLGLRFEARHTRVTRTGDGAFDNEAAWMWGAARLERDAGDGQLRVDLGIGRHRVWDHIELAPSLSYRVGGPTLQGRVGIERLVLPVWTDLASGQAPFLQRTWAGVLEARGAWSDRLQAWSVLMFGRTQDRALVSRAPLEELWLREGVRMDPERYDFGLFWLGGALKPGPFTLGGEGFVLVRERSAAQALVDPAKGFRSYASWQFALFQGDLGVTLRAGADGIGARDSEGLPSRSLPGYVTYNAAVYVTLADALITMQARNLEDQQRDQVWFDSDTGLEALGPGRELRFSVTLRLSD